MKSLRIPEVLLLLSVVDLEAALVDDFCQIRNLSVTVDDYMRIYIDGVEKTNLPYAGIFNKLDVVALPCTARVIAIHGRNKPGGYPAGILASTDDDYVLTNSSWKCSNVSYKGWEETDFDDSTWMSAVEFGRSGEYYLEFVPGFRPNAVWIWMRQWNGQFDSTYEEMDQVVYCRKRLVVSTGNDSTSSTILGGFFGVFVLPTIALISALWVLRLQRKTVKDESRDQVSGMIKVKQPHLIGRDEQDKVTSNARLYDFPLEMLDIILQKSYLHWSLNSRTKQRDEEVIRSLISVDVCFNRRISRKRFKRAIWRYLKDFYRKTKKISAIVINNRNYLLANIQPNDELIASLLSLNCITEEQSHFIQRQRSNRVKNAELLYVVRSFDVKKFSNFVKCLRQAKQKTVARIMENGGGVIKIEVQTLGAKRTTSMETQLLHQKIEDLRNRSRSWSNQTYKLISQLREKGIEILNSQLDRQTLVVWIWCRSRAALANVQSLCISHQLRDVFFENTQPSTSRMVNIDRNQFKKTIVVCPISVNFTQKIDQGKINELVWGVAKLGNEIYVLCQSRISFTYIFHVSEDENQFLLQKNFEIKEIKEPVDIGSSEKENCLYVSDCEEKCFWKITKEKDDQHKIIKWLTTDYEPSTLSVSNDGQLLIVSTSSSSLMIYGSDAELIRSIQLPRDLKPRHAVETSIGNFTVLHNKRISGGMREIGWGISKVTRDGHMVIRNFIPSNETQKLNDPTYLSIDSNDQVFVSDYGNDRVVLLDSDLKWNRILCPTKEEVKRTRIQRSFRFCYDDEKKQLFVGGGDGVSVYTLSRN